MIENFIKEYIKILFTDSSVYKWKMDKNLRIFFGAIIDGKSRRGHSMLGLTGGKLSKSQQRQVQEFIEKMKSESAAAMPD